MTDDPVAEFRVILTIPLYEREGRRMDSTRFALEKRIRKELFFLENISVEIEYVELAAAQG
jgi:hypothetical protein